MVFDSDPHDQLGKTGQRVHPHFDRLFRLSRLNITEHTLVQEISNGRFRRVAPADQFTPKHKGQDVPTAPAGSTGQTGRQGQLNLRLLPPGCPSVVDGVDQLGDLLANPLGFHPRQEVRNHWALPSTPLHREDKLLHLERDAIPGIVRPEPPGTFEPFFVRLGVGTGFVLPEKASCDLVFHTDSIFSQVKGVYKWRGMGRKS